MAEMPLPDKKDVVSALLQGPSVFVHLDPRKDGVVVPNWLKNQPRLMLQIGLNMAIPIPDLDVGERGIGCTLSFNRAPFWCFIPWPAIFALAGEDERGMVWPDDVPSELMQAPQRAPGDSLDRRGGAKAGPRLLQPAEEARPARKKARSRPAAEASAAERGKKKLPPYLRVIK